MDNSRIGATALPRSTSRIHAHTHTHTHTHLQHSQTRRDAHLVEDISKVCLKLFSQHLKAEMCLIMNKITDDFFFECWKRNYSYELSLFNTLGAPERHHGDHSREYACWAEGAAWGEVKAYVWCLFFAVSKKKDPKFLIKWASPPPRLGMATHANRQAQKLRVPISSGLKLLGSDHRAYVMKDVEGNRWCCVPPGSRAAARGRW